MLIISASSAQLVISASDIIGCYVFAVLLCSAQYCPGQLHEEFFQRREAARLYKAKVRGELYDDRVNYVHLLFTFVSRNSVLVYCVDSH